MSRTLAITLLAFALAGCGTSPTGTAASSVKGGASVPADVTDAQVLAEEVCAGSTYSRCVSSMVTAMNLFDAGSLVAICEYENGEGDIVLLEAEADAEDECSGGGLFPDYLDVFDVVQLPQ